MSTEFIAVLGTLLGALVGGAINYVSSRSVKSREWQLALARDQAQLRQRLYAEFLIEAQHLVVQSREDKIRSLSELNALTAKFAEIRLVAYQPLVEASKAVADYALTSHAAQPATEVAEFFALTDRFILAARNDIETILKNV